jgi:hypothetical protein
MHRRNLISAALACVLAFGTTILPPCVYSNISRSPSELPNAAMPATKMGAFTQGLYDEAKKSGWVVVSMRDDWKRIFAFEK